MTGKKWKTNRRTLKPFASLSPSYADHVLSDAVGISVKQLRELQKPLNEGRHSNRFMGSVESATGKRHLNETEIDSIKHILFQYGVEDEDIFPHGFDGDSPWAFDFYVYGKRRATEVRRELAMRLSKDLFTSVDFDSEENKFREEFPNESEGFAVADLPAKSTAIMFMPPQVIRTDEE